MKIAIDLPEKDAETYFRLLNEDGGLRERAVEKLLQQNTAAGIEERTSYIKVLGAIARGFYLSLEAAGRLNSSSRHRELLKLAFPE